MKTKIKTNGRYFTTLREKQNLTIKELSQKTGISKTTLSNIENNKVIPRMRTLLKLVKFYKISLKELFENYQTFSPIFLTNLLFLGLKQEIVG